MYTLGAVVFMTKRPDPSPRWFGYHEVFHAFTIVAYLAQYAGISLVVYRSALHPLAPHATSTGSRVGSAASLDKIAHK